MRRMTGTLAVLLISCGACPAGELAVPQLVVASFRSGDTELFVVDPVTGDAAT